MARCSTLMRHVTPSRRPQLPDMKLSINGADVEVDDRHAKTPLLWVLRDVLGLHGTKFGCGIGYCAACTVLLNGKNTKSCQTPAERDRKSTRLNSSHLVISYAVFCLK